MATINGVEVIGDKTAHDFDLLDKDDGINLANGIERNREATEDNHEDIVLHRTDTDVHVTPEWKNSLVSKETLGLYWTAAQTADIINEISIAGGAKLVKVEVLPAVGLEQTIYLVPKADPQAGDVFDEYVWVDGKYEFIGTTKVDLSNYATKAELNAKQDALSIQQLSNIDNVPNKANDADVVHKSGNETIDGLKTFGRLDPEGGQIDLEKSNFSLLTTNISIDSVGESLRFFARDSGGIYTTFNFDFQTRTIYCDRECVWGTTNSKFADVNTKAINGINPGALSFPGASYVNIDTTEWVLDGSTVNQISTLNSYAYLSLMTDCDDDGFIEISIGNYPNGHVYINSKSVHGHCGVFIPFFNINSYMRFFIRANSIRYARWYPLQGNV